MVRRDVLKGYLILLINKTMVNLSFFMIKFFNIAMWPFSVLIAVFGVVMMGWCPKREKKDKFFIQVWDYIRFVLRDAGMYLVLWSYQHGNVPRLSALFFSASFVLPLGASIFFKEKVPPVQWMLMLLGLVGVGLIVQVWNFELSFNILLDGAAILASIVIAVNYGILKKILQKGMNQRRSFQRSAYFRVATVLAYYMFFEVDLQSFFIMPEGLSPLCLCVVLTFVGILQNLGTILHVKGISYGNLSYIPFVDLWRFCFAWLVGYFVFDQTLQGFALYGTLIILTVVVLMACVAKKSKS